MLRVTADQGFVFTVLACFGLVLGLWYDALSLLRQLLGLGRVGTAVLDILFWLGAAAGVTMLLWRVCWGELRPFALLALACGLCWYALMLSPALRAAARRLEERGRHIRERLSRGRVNGVVLDKSARPD